MQQYLLSRIQFISRTLSAVDDYRQRINGLLSIGLDFGSVANFGCRFGDETLALLWLLGAEEAVGIDKDERRIVQARDTARQFGEHVEAVRRALYYDVVSDEIRSQIKDLLELCGNRAVPSFIVADITQRTSLPSDHFDLSYCESVLCHITGDNDQTAMTNTLSAIQEMARVTRHGGLVAAIEPKTRSPEDPRPVHLDQVYCQAGLIRLEVDGSLFSIEGKNVYLYSKPK